MKDDEIIKAYMLQVNEIIDAIRGLGEKIEDQVIVKKGITISPILFSFKGVYHRRSQKFEYF